MIKLKTSDRISISFALLTGVFVLFFWIAINILFFVSWTQQDKSQANRFVSSEQEKLRKFGLSQNNRMAIIPQKDNRLSSLKHTIRPGIKKLEDDRYITRPLPRQNIIIVDVTEQMKRQLLLIRIALWLVVIFSFLAYGIGKIQTRRALRDIYNLAAYLQTIQINTLNNYAIDLSHLPADDEIRIVSDTIDQMTKRLSQQVKSIENFVNNVSHELKTPLMAMRAKSEVAIQTKKYKSALEHTIAVTQSLSSLVETLLDISRLQDGTTVKIQKVWIQKLLDVIVPDILEQYSIKNLQYQQKIEDFSVEAPIWLLERIIVNVMDNACKYANKNWSIQITYKDKKIEISNTGTTISKKDLSHIWEPFWQADRSKQTDWFGMGLYFVKELVVYMWWDIEVKSTSKKTTFIIHMR